MTYVFLVLSLTLNGVLIWYVLQLVRRLWLVSENMGDLFLQLGEFADHVDRVNKMEVYYGDTVLQNLLDHSRNIVEEVERYKDIHDAFEEDDDKDEGEIEG